MGSITGSTNEHIYVPAAILNPDLDTNCDQQFLLHDYVGRYSTNSGTAVGIGPDEAVLHAVNEQFERHMLSKLYLQIVFGEQQGFELLGSLRIEARELGLLTAELTVPDAWVVVREADEELSFCCVVEKLNEGAGKLALLASGASSDQHHACTRAISEFVQCFVLTDAAEHSEDHKVLKFLSTVKKLKPLITLETIEDFPRSRLKSLVPCDKRNVSQILASVVRSLAPDHHVYARTEALGSFGVTVAQVYVTGFERFHLIRTGKLVAPLRVLQDGRV